MELTTLLGMVAAITGLLGGMYFKGVPFSALANPAAIFIILVGTIGAVLNAFPLSDVKSVGALFKNLFTSGGHTDNVEMIKTIINYSQDVRKEGLLSMEKKIPEIKDPFLKRGFELLMDGQGHDHIQDTLMQEIESIEERHTGNLGIFTQAGTYAPTLGVLGAVIGLIAALGHMDDVEALGHAISAAFMATAYGIFTGYVLWHPFANKLKRKTVHEITSKSIILDGILLLEQGVAPNLIQDKLASYLSSTEKAKLYGKK